MLGYAIDISNYSGIPSKEQVQALFADGFRRVIIGLQNKQVAQQQFDLFAEVGFEIQAYAFVWFDRGANGGQQVRDKFALLEGRIPSLLWIDCEDDENIRSNPALGMTGRGASDLTELECLAIIQSAADACQGLVWSGIYTRADWWIRQTGNSRQFAGYPLWDATNDRKPDLGMRIPYGGWTGSSMEQYMFDTQKQGLTVDLNVYSIPDPIITPATAPVVIAPAIVLAPYAEFTAPVPTFNPQEGAFDYELAIQRPGDYNSELGMNVTLTYKDHEPNRNMDRYLVRLKKTW